MKTSSALAISLVLSLAAVGCALPDDGGGDPTTSQSSDDLAIRSLGFYVTQWPATAIVWPTNAQNVIVMLHNGYATDSFCTSYGPPCDAPSYGHAIVAAEYTDGSLGTYAIYQFETGATSRFISQLQTTYAAAAPPTSIYQWQIQGGLTGPPLPPHGPGGTGEYSASDISYINGVAAAQINLQAEQTSYQY